VDAGGFAHTGQSSFKYNKTGNGSGIFWFYAWLPAQNPPQTARLSFFLRCDNSTAWTLDVLVNDAKVATATQAICIKDFQRMTADLAAFPPGKVKIEFKMTKTVPQAVTLYLDDLAILSDNCNAAAACVSYTPQAGVCTQSAITGGTCYIDYTCYAQDGANPANKCAVCKPSTSQTAWSPDDAKCDDGNPATTDKCSVTDGCANF
jgi:hypothetical protein